MLPLIAAKNMLFMILTIRSPVFSLIDLVRLNHVIRDGKRNTMVLKNEVTWSLLVTSSMLYVASAMKSIYPIASRSQIQIARSAISYKIMLNTLRIMSSCLVHMPID